MVLQQCLNCKKRQSIKNDACNKCGADLQKCRRTRKVPYFIQYRLPEGKQRREFVGHSLKKAKDADAKRKVQKRENRIFDMLPDAEVTFNELAEWYLGKRKVKKLTSFPRIRTCINHFIDVFGSTVVGDIRLDDLEDYQEMREEVGMAPATIDLEVQMAAQMVRNAWDNDRVSDTPVKAFRRLKNKLRFGQNARKRYVTLEEYQALCESAAPHVRAQVIAIYNTGMRPGEIRALRYEYIDYKARMIRLPAEITKEKRAKDIPINRHLAALLKSLPRSLHHDFVFTYNGQPLVRTIRIGLRNACRNADLPYGRKEKDGITLHDFRGTFKTNLRKAGVNKAVRDAMVGHAQQGMDRHYDTVDDQDLLEGMGQFEAWFDNEAEKASETLPTASEG